jgi:hypothetical protein
MSREVHLRHMTSTPLVSLVGLSLGLSACTTHAFTPSSRPMPLTSAVAPAKGTGDVQVDGSASGEPLGPGIHAGNVRYRRGVTDSLAFTGDVGLARAHGEDPSSETRWAAMARAGAQLSGDLNSELAIAGYAGAGAGYAPAAGGWIGGDVGSVISFKHSSFRPAVLTQLYVSEPVASEDFMVDGTTLVLPRTFGAQALVGADIGAGAHSVLVGLAIARLWAAATTYEEAKAATFLGIGAGFRFATE